MVDDVSFGTAADHMAGVIVSQFNAKLWAQPPQKIHVANVPASRWDAIKAALPARLVEALFAPVKWRPVWVDVSVIYPKLNVAMPREASTLRIVTTDPANEVTFKFRDGAGRR